MPTNPLVRLTVLLATALLIGGCATFAPNPSAHATASTNIGVVFGRDVVLLDGEVCKSLSNKLIPSQVITHLSPFLNMDSVTHNAYVPGKWAFRAYLKDDGYFAVALPPGRYYFVEHQYLSIITGTPLLGMRSYQNILSNTVNQPFITTFEVIQGRSTYIGSFAHILHTTNDRKSWSWNMQVADESEKAIEWFQSHYPDAAPVERVLAVNTPIN